MYLYLSRFFNCLKGGYHHLCVECFSQLSFDSAAEIVYISESNESCEKHSTQRWTHFSGFGRFGNLSLKKK